MVSPLELHQDFRMNDSARARVRLEPGNVIGARTLRSTDASSITIPDPGGALVHLQFRRYAGCPICSLHLRSFAQRHDEIVRSGIREVVVFHSSDAELREVHRLPFTLIADPEKRLYAEFGVGTSAAAVLDPRVWPTAIRAIALRASTDPGSGMGGGALGLPADFLIGSDGRVIASKYGVHANDHWSVEALLALARELSGTRLAGRAVR